MIDITLVRDDRTGILRADMTGHAGYAPEGKDIVCASVSALALALHAWAAGRGSDVLEAERSQSDGAHFCFVNGLETRTAWEVFRAGVASIAAEYPDFVHLTEKFCEGKKIFQEV